MKVLVPFDLEPASERAVRFAIESYSGTPINIHAVHFTDKQNDTVSATIDSAINNIVTEEEFEEDEIVTKIVQTQTRDDEKQIADEIVTYAEQHDIDQIVVGHKQKSRLDKLLKNSATSYLVKERTTPVTLVP